MAAWSHPAILPRSRLAIHQRARSKAVVEDDATSKEQGIAVFQRFINRDKVSAIIGPTLSNTATAADPLAQAAKLRDAASPRLEVLLDTGEIEGRRWFGLAGFESAGQAGEIGLNLNQAGQLVEAGDGVGPALLMASHGQAAGSHPEIPASQLAFDDTLRTRPRQGRMI